MSRNSISSIYLVGSLRNPKIPLLANHLRKKGFDVFDDWFSAGFFADDCLRHYEKLRGHNYKQALQGYAAQHIFEFDKKHLDRCDATVLLMPAGRSGFLELGYSIGQGKPSFILFETEPKRIDVMFQFATEIFFNRGELIEKLKENK